MPDNNSSEPVVAMVVAAGSGVRLGGETPKALRTVAGVPLVTRSVRQLAAGGCTHAIVVIAPRTEEAFRAALADAPVPVTFVEGGHRRQDSVLNGLVALAEDEGLEHAQIVLVHDAARALVPVEVVARVVDAVAAGAVAVTPVVPVVDTIRQLNEVGSAAIDRSLLRAVQTPQGFDRETLIEAHRLVADHQLDVTDDIAACEFAGEVATLVEGDVSALKITTPLDLVVAEALVSGVEA